MLKKILLAVALMATLSMAGSNGMDLSAQECTWSLTRMDASRTGVGVPTVGNTEKALGKVKGCKYIAPNGKVYKGGTIGKVAKVVMDAQPTMAAVKRVIGQSDAVMTKHSPESPLSNFAVDVLMKRTAAEAGRPVHAGILNFGGIRVDMPEGDILVDDIMSMFPFKNNLIYISIKGSNLRAVIEKMAASYVQVLGGVRVVIRDRKVVSLEVAGEPIDDNRIYGLATISFLLHGGDGISLADVAEDMIDIPINIYDAIYDHIVAETAAGRSISASLDGRVTVL